MRLLGAITHFSPSSTTAPRRHIMATMLVLFTVLNGCTSATWQPTTGDNTTVTTQQDSADNELIVSVIGTNDLHGQLLPQRGRAGIEVLSGYVASLRKVRAADGGAVLLIDAGDMWQGTLESNLSEGAAMLSAYNALGFTAAAIGNHEFDFGPVGERATPQSGNDDPRGALKQRATEANFPLLAANLIDNATDLPVNWPMLSHRC